MKKLIAALLVLAMVLSLSVAAFAEGETGTITISNAQAGNTYKVYKVFDAIGNGTGISYTLVDGKTAAPAGFSVDAAGNVTYDGEGDTLTADDIAALGAYVANDAPVATVVAEGATVTVENLPNGYYYITTTTGTAVTVTSTNPNAAVTDKNEAPSIDKEVQEDSNSSWGKENDADIGQTVNYKTVVTAQKGAQNYIVHDKMSAGLTLNADSIAVAGAVKGTDYTVSANTADGCTFEIAFAQAYLDKITEETAIEITYSAVLNENAVISTGANTNDTKLSYGNESKNETEWIQTKTYTFKFDLVKTDNANKVLTGAKFKLYDAATEGNEIAVVKVEEGLYRLAVEGETGVEIEAGSVTIKGLDGGTTYYLEETVAPAGYNKLTERTAVVIDNANLEANVAENVWTAGGVQVINQAGSTLPSTGGMGTTLFYVLGSILVIGAGVLLVTKKRMSAM